MRSRNADVAAILDEKELFPSSKSPVPVAYAGGGDGTMVMDHEIVFVSFVYVSCIIIHVDLSLHNTA